MTNALKIEIVDSPDKAPHYRRDHVDIRGVSIKKVIVVAKGTQAGKPTVDFQLVAQDGSEFVTMLTGELVKQLANVIAGVEARG
jgi:hypothetical protein